MLRAVHDARRDPERPWPRMGQLAQPLRFVWQHPVRRHVALCSLVFSAVQVCVADDGDGMGTGVLESGLRNMRARATRHGGDFVVQSRDGAGTTVVWRVPLAAERG